MITIEQYFMGRDKLYPEELTDNLKSNAEVTVNKTNQLMTIYCQETGNQCPGVRSGWRPKEINAKTPGASKSSHHMTCEAIDLGDSTNALKDWCLTNLIALEQIGLWMEDPECCPSWCHLQTVSPKSGHRVFIA